MKDTEDVQVICSCYGNQEFVAFLTFLIRMNFAFSYPMANF